MKLRPYGDIGADKQKKIRSLWNVDMC